MRKILHVLTGAHTGGISTTVLNFYKELNDDNIHFDLAITKNAIGINGKQFIELGSKIYVLPPKSKRPIKYMFSLYKLLITGKYDAIHVHENLTSFVALFVGKVAGVKVRIAHAHTACEYKSLYDRTRQKLSHFFNPLFATKLIACSTDAGKVIFGTSKKIVVINNGVSFDRFKYSEAIRAKIRMEIQAENKTIIGTVGRIAKEKNQAFLLDVFSDYYKRNKDSLLVIIGDGPLKNDLYNQISALNLNSAVLMLGIKSNVEEYLQAFDVFVLPSVFEGFPVSAAEALVSGLDVFLSETITHDLSDFSNVIYLPLDDKKVWTSALEKIHQNKDAVREKKSNRCKNSMIDSSNSAQLLLNVYISG